MLRGQGPCLSCSLLCPWGLVQSKCSSELMNEHTSVRMNSSESLSSLFVYSLFTPSTLVYSTPFNIAVSSKLSFFFLTECSTYIALPAFPGYCHPLPWRKCWENNTNMFCDQKRLHLAICDNMDGSRGCYKSDKKDYLTLLIWWP